MNLTSVSLRVAGVLVTTIGVGHIFMPTFGYRGAVPSGMEPAIREHFYFLGTYAICCFLLGFGVLTLMASKEPRARATQLFSGVMTGVWAFRFVLELRYPVSVPIFFLEDPHPSLMVILATITGAFALAAFSARRGIAQDA